MNSSWRRRSLWIAACGVVAVCVVALATGHWGFGVPLAGALLGAILLAVLALRSWLGRISTNVLEIRRTMKSVAGRLGSPPVVEIDLSRVEATERRLLGVIETERLRAQDASREVLEALTTIRSELRDDVAALTDLSRESQASSRTRHRRLREALTDFRSESDALSTELAGRIEATERRLLGVLEAERLTDADRHVEILGAVAKSGTSRNEYVERQLASVEQSAGQVLGRVHAEAQALRAALERLSSDLAAVVGASVARHNEISEAVRSVRTRVDETAGMNEARGAQLETSVQALHASLERAALVQNALSAVREALAGLQFHVGAQGGTDDSAEAQASALRDALSNIEFLIINRTNAIVGTLLTNHGQVHSKPDA